MQIVIDIPEDVYTRLFDNGRPTDLADGIVMERAIRLGTPLPKGHGDLIDRNSVDDFLLPRQDSDAEWCATGETIKRLIRDAFKKAPTIIEADKGDKE